MAKPSKARGSAPLVVAFVVLLLLIAGYLANALWNTLHLSRADGAALLAAVTLPAPLMDSAIPQWAEIASASVFLALVVLALLTMRAASNRRRRDANPFAADIADIYIAPTPRNTARRSLLGAPDAPTAAGASDPANVSRPPEADASSSGRPGTE